MTGGMAQMADRGGSKVEQHTIYPIPLTERHGRARDLFTLWFGSNIMMLSIVTGALATSLFKLDLVSAILAILIGNLVGGIFMALHAAQGPQLGVPQMVQSRGQFGSVGAIFIVLLVVVMYMGFVASNLVLGGQSLHTIVAPISDEWGIVIIAFLSVAAAIYGYDLIHAYGRWMTWICGLALLVSFVWIIFVSGLPADLWQRGSLTLAGFLGALSAGALWQIAYAPYVSDYSRYMPVDSGVKPTFWASYWGCVLGSSAAMLLGALLGLIAEDGNVVNGFAVALGPIGIGVIVALSLGIGACSAMNVYCGVLSTITVAQTFLPNWKAGALARILLSALFVAIATAMALSGAKNFMTNYENFLALLLAVMTPWTAINLVDFYLVQHGTYDVESFFAADGGRYGRYNAVALFCYGVGIAVQLPFLAIDLYTGPIAKAFGGVDISWIVGLAVVGPLYWALARAAGRSDMAADQAS